MQKDKLFLMLKLLWIESRMDKENKLQLIIPFIIQFVNQKINLKIHLQNVALMIVHTKDSSVIVIIIQSFMVKMVLCKLIKSIIRKNQCSQYGELLSIFKIFRLINFYKNLGFLMMPVRNLESKCRLIVNKDRLSLMEVSLTIIFKKQSYFLIPLDK